MSTKNKIVLVPFPFDDLTADKLRPAACLTNPIGVHHHVVLAFITSQIPEDITDTDIVLKTDRPDFPITGLHVASTIRLHRLLTVTASIIKRELGQLSTNMELEVIILNYDTCFHSSNLTRRIMGRLGW